MRSVLSDFFSVARSKVFIILSGLFKSIIIARTLGPEQNGLIAGLMVYTGLFVTIGALGVRKSSAYLVGNSEFSYNDIIKVLLQAWIVTLIFVVPITFLVIYYGSSFSYDNSIILLAILPMPFTLLNNYCSGIYLGRNEISKLNKIEWIPALSLMIMTYFFLVIFEWSVEGVFLAEFFSAITMSTILFFKLNIKEFFSFSVNLKLLKLIYSLGIAYAVSLIVINLNYRIDVILMGFLSTKFEIGIYTKGAALTQYLWHIPMLLGTIVFARGIKTTEKRVFSLKVCRLLRLSLISACFGSILLVYFAKDIILIMFGDDFIESASVLIILMPGVIILIIFKVLNMDIGSRGKPWFVLKSMVPALIVNIILNFLFVPKYGADGAAFSSTISYSFGALIFLIQYSRYTDIKISSVFQFSVEDFDILIQYYKRSLKKLL